MGAGAGEQLMYLGYNTNGFANHRLEDAIRVMAELGYQGVAITLDHHALNPLDLDTAQLERVRRLLDEHQLRSVIETGARFLLDRRVKHEPTLVSRGWSAREHRAEFLKRAVTIAAELGSDCVSLWSGVVHDDADEDTVWDRLLFPLTAVADVAAGQQIPLGFEPEPGMFIDTLERFEQLLEKSSLDLQLTMDVGHVFCQSEGDVPQLLTQFRDRLVNVHLEDMRRGEHEHLMFGEGEMEFEPILRTLDKLEYTGGVFVELSRHSHQAVQAARAAYAFLSPWYQRENTRRR